jgi:hypothetical protein
MLRKPLAVCILLLEKLYVDKTGEIIASFDDSY